MTSFYRRIVRNTKSHNPGWAYHPTKGWRRERTRKGPHQGFANFIASIGPTIKRRAKKACALCLKPHRHNNRWCSARCCHEWRAQQ